MNIGQPAKKIHVTEDKVKSMLRDYGIPTTDFMLIRNEDDLDRTDIKFPAVLKVCSPDIIHKTDIGGVRLNIMDKEELRKNVIRFSKKFPGKNFLIEGMEPQGIEMIAGLIHDKSFGLSIMVGMGGIFAEMYGDVAFRLVPITMRDAEGMIDELKASKIFKGFRGMKPDKKAVASLLLKLSRIGMDCPSINQMDLNPVFVYENGLKVVDAKLIKGE
ncbi:MAG: acetate--CoA ligase family protein [Candidatus Thermoplasmatota archaeon]|nr:acetate--CoA ligase family protein [Candidatus Thermoplasmatota archaeon]